MELKKRYLLTAGDGYYPCSGTRDWIACYETQEEAEAQVTRTDDGSFRVAGYASTFDWYHVIDLASWVGAEHEYDERTF
jgi:hypothetical protein